MAAGKLPTEVQPCLEIQKTIQNPTASQSIEPLPQHVCESLHINLHMRWCFCAAEAQPSSHESFVPEAAHYLALFDILDLASNMNMIESDFPAHQ